MDFEPVLACCDAMEPVRYGSYGQDRCVNCHRYLSERQAYAAHCEHDDFVIGENAPDVCDACCAALCMDGDGCESVVTRSGRFCDRHSRVPA